MQALSQGCTKKNILRNVSLYARAHNATMETSCEIYSQFVFFLVIVFLWRGFLEVFNVVARGGINCCEVYSIVHL